MIVYLASPNERDGMPLMRWATVKEFGGGVYQVSDSGVIRNSLTGKPLKPWTDKKGYLSVSLYGERRRKNMLVHRAVASAFLPNPLGLPEVNHKDGNSKNNAAGNLEWCTRQENVRHAVEMGLVCRGERHGMAKLTPESVVAMREDAAAGATLNELSGKYGVTFGRAGAIVRGDSWKNCGGPITRRGLDHARRPR